MGAEEQELQRWEDEGGAVLAVEEHGREDAPRRRLSTGLRLMRKAGVAIAGGSVLLAGVALIVLPGPAIVVIPLGLAILATEFPWAHRLLHAGKTRLARLMARLRAGLAGAGWGAVPVRPRAL